MDEKGNTQSKKNPLLRAMYPLGGRPPKYSTPAELWAKFEEYVEHVDENPWKTQQRSKGQRSHGDTDSKEIRANEQLIRCPYTLTGFCLFSGLYEWTDYKKRNAHRRGFAVVIRAIEEFIKDNQITGAMIGEFKENLVARLNGINDTQVIKDSRNPAKPLSEEERQEQLQRLREFFYSEEKH